MKQSDLVIGQSYAFQPNSYATSYEVEVLEFGLPGPKYLQFRGIRVLVRRTGKEMTVFASQISQPWDEYVADVARRDEAKVQAQQLAEIQLRERASFAKEVDSGLTGVGAPRGTRYVYRDWARKTLAEAGFVFDGNQTESRIRDLDSIMSGKGLGEDDARALLGFPPMTRSLSD